MKRILAALSSLLLTFSAQAEVVVDFATNFEVYEFGTSFGIAMPQPGGVFISDAPEQPGAAVGGFLFTPSQPVDFSQLALTGNFSTPVDVSVEIFDGDSIWIFALSAPLSPTLSTLSLVPLYGLPDGPQAIYAVSIIFNDFLAPTDSGIIASLEVIPEPSTALAGAVGVGVILLARRRRRYRA